MSPTQAFILALLATRTGLRINLDLEKDEVQKMQEHEEFLHQEMTRLLQEMEGSSGIMEALLYWAWQQQRLLWVTAAALALLLLGMGRGLLRRKRGCASCREALSRNFSSGEKVSSEKFGYGSVNHEEKVSRQEKGGSREVISSEE